MSDTFNTTVANWQGIDDEPVAGSKNLVESGGVWNAINNASYFGSNYSPVGYNVGANVSVGYIASGYKLKSIKVRLRSTATSFTLDLQYGGSKYKTFTFDNVIAGEDNTFDLGGYVLPHDSYIFVNSPVAASDGGIEIYGNIRICAYIIYQGENATDEIQKLKAKDIELQSAVDYIEKTTSNIPINDFFGNVYFSAKTNASANKSVDLIPKSTKLKKIHVRLRENATDFSFSLLYGANAYKEFYFDNVTPNADNVFDLGGYILPNDSSVFINSPVESKFGGIKIVGDISVCAYIEIEPSQKTIVNCWGDSLTVGAGSSDNTNKSQVVSSLVNMGYPSSMFDDNNITYPDMLHLLLGDNFLVNNLGVGGENINTIAARQGSAPAFVNTGFTLPADAGVTVKVADTNLISMFDFSSAVKPLQQGSPISVNPCYLNGIPCTLSYNSNDNSYYVERVQNENRNVVIPAKTPFIMNGAKKYHNDNITILWCWTNGGYNNDNQELLEKLRKMADFLNSKKYIIIGVHNRNTDVSIIQEDLLSSAFGAKFFNWRLYASTNALYDFSITPTAEDITAMNNGSIPPSILSDSVHLNEAGYMIIGFKIYELIKNLGYINE